VLDVDSAWDVKESIVRCDEVCNSVSYYTKLEPARKCNFRRKTYSCIHDTFEVIGG